MYFFLENASGGIKLIPESRLVDKSKEGQLCSQRTLDALLDYCKNTNINMPEFDTPEKYLPNGEQVNSDEYKLNPKMVYDVLKNTSYFDELLCESEKWQKIILSGKYNNYIYVDVSKLEKYGWKIQYFADDFVVYYNQIRAKKIYWDGENLFNTFPFKYVHKYPEALDATHKLEPCTLSEECHLYKSTDDEIKEYLVYAKLTSYQVYRNTD